MIFLLHLPQCNVLHVRSKATRDLGGLTVARQFHSCDFSSLDQTLETTLHHIEAATRAMDETLHWAAKEAEPTLPTKSKKRRTAAPSRTYKMQP